MACWLGGRRRFGPRHAPIQIGSTADSLAYDANGNLIARGTKALQYDPRNRLMRVAIDGATVARHTYDGEGVRTKRLDANGTIHYVGRRYERNVGNGASLPDVGTTYIEAQLGPRTVLLAFRKGGQLTVVGTDHLGGTLATAAAGAGLPVTGRLRYTPYGQGLGASGNFGTDRGFTGQTVDAMAGLYWFASRSYDPSIGRFVQPDTVVPDWTNPQALNRYAYALNNPLRYVDPSGHTPAPPTGSPWIAVDLFIQQRGLQVGPFVVVGDGRGYGYGTDPGASRAYAFISVDQSQPDVIRFNPSIYVVLGDDGRPLGMGAAPSASDAMTVTRNGDGSITVRYDTTISGPLEGRGPRLNGEVTFTPDGNGGYTASGRRDGFPWMEAYAVDAQGNPTLITQRDAVRGSPDDLNALGEPSRFTNLDVGRIAYDVYSMIRDVVDPLRVDAFP